MDGGRHDEFSLGQARSIDHAGGARARTRARSGSPRPSRDKLPLAPARKAPKAFHYASGRTMTLGQLADMLPPGPAQALSADARRMPVIAMRLTSRTGAAVHAPPALTEGALFIDHRDLAALDAGAVVPDLAAVVERVR